MNSWTLEEFNLFIGQIKNPLISMPHSRTLYYTVYARRMFALNLEDVEV